MCYADPEAGKTQGVNLTVSKNYGGEGHALSSAFHWLQKECVADRMYLF